MFINHILIGALIKRPKYTRLKQEERAEAKRLYGQEFLTIRYIADIFGVSHMTIWRIVRR